MRLGLGFTAVPLQDGTGSWNASAADALDIWNGYLDFIHISSVSLPAVPEQSGDGINSVFFSTTIFGDSFGADTLAITVLRNSASQPSVMREADVIVNSANRFNSYRGPLRSDAVFDLHRILLHEFGHVLGLDHVSSYPLKTKIMEPVISDWDHLGADDIAGVHRLYSTDFYSPTSARTIRIGYLFDDFLNVNESNGVPTLYSATGLPPGITIDSHTGWVSGNATQSGVFNGVITAHFAFGDIYKPLQLTVLGIEEIPGLLEVIPFQSAVSLLADPIRPRVYIASYTGVSMINTTNFALTTLVPGPWGDARLSISADSSTLLFTKDSTLPVQENRIDLETLSSLPAIPLPDNRSAVLEGSNNLAYVTGRDGVFQIDATTGDLQQIFATPPPNSGLPLIPKIAISPDRQTLYVAREADLSSYDISTANPVLQEQISGSFVSLVPSTDNKYLYYLTENAGVRSLLQAQLPALSPARLISTSRYLDVTAVAPNGAIYQTLFPSYSGGLTQSASYSVYDPTTLHQTGHVASDNFLPEQYRAGYPYDIQSGAVDNSGKYYFAIVSEYFGTEVWVFSTDLASFPPPPVHPTKNLLNISTRGRVEAGENAMIGGFIVQGPQPKKVLIRGLGPSLPLTGALSNPVLDLYDSSRKHLASNDDWTSNGLAITASLLAPSSPREAALLVTLQPGAYTAIVRDHDNQPGQALVEVYDLSPKDSWLANISTRGMVQTGDNVMIGGFIIGGTDPTKVLVRAIGPSLATKGIAYPLADPILELHDGNGKLIFTNDDWRSTQASGIIATGIPPTDNRESAILITLQPGNYTAIVRGKNGATGVALVEVYNLDSSTPPAK